ncbi:MAG: DUF192 domain-containing protein [Rhizobiaceae bacterium]
MKPVSVTALILFAFVALLPVSSTANPMNTVTIDTRSGSPAWSVELASDEASRSKGLMYRKSMAAKSGMLFRFETTRAVAMWMKNTFIPLDMIFADNAGKVTHIHRGAVPHSLDVISSRVPARFVLEVNAGEADRHGVTVGDRLRHPWILPAN